MRRLTPCTRLSCRGVTLIETMVAVSIAALLAVSGLPFFGDYVVNSRLREGGNVLHADALFAQSEAIKRNGLVSLELSDSVVKVIDRSGGDAVVLRSRPLPSGVSLDITEPVKFTSAGRITPFGRDYTIKFSMSGVTCSDDKRCPALRIEAGGAIRLCGNKLACE